MDLTEPSFKHDTKEPNKILNLTCEISEEPAKDQPQERSDVEFRLLLGKMDAELVTDARQAFVHVAHHLREDLVHRLQNELHEATLAVALWGLLHECTPENSGWFEFIVFKK